MLTIWPTPLTSLLALVPSIADSLPCANRPKATIDPADYPRTKTATAVGSELIAVSGCVST